MISLRSYSKYESSSLHVLGIVLFFVSLLMIPPLVLSFYNNENPVTFIVPMILGLVVSIPLIIFFRNPTTMRPPDGLMMVIILWLALFAYGTIPYLIQGLPFIDAVFESFSGFTTAGALP